MTKQSAKDAKALDKKIRYDAITVSETTSAILSTKTLTAAAKLLGIQRSALYLRLDKYPQIREVIDKQRLNASLTLINNSQRAADTVVGGLTDEKQKYNMAQDILDRVGVSKQTNQTNIQVSNLQGLIQINVEEK